MQQRTHRLVRALVTWTLTAGVAAAVVAAVDRRALAAALSRADARLLAAALAVTLLGNLLVGPARWRFILGRLGIAVSLSRAVFIKVAGAPAKLALPMKSGELLRALYLHRRTGANLQRCVSSVLMEKAGTLLAAGVFLLAGLVLGGVERWRWEAGATTGALLLLFASRGGRRLAGGALRRVSGRLARGFDDLVSAFAELRFPEKAGILLFSLLFVVTEMAIAFLSFRALGVEDPAGRPVPLSAFMVFIPLSVLASIPTFSGIGTREGLAAWFFSAAGPFQADYGTPEERVAAMLMVTVIYYLFVPVVGLPFLGRFLQRSLWKEEVHDGSGHARPRG